MWSEAPESIIQGILIWEVAFKVFRKFSLWTSGPKGTCGGLTRCLKAREHFVELLHLFRIRVPLEASFFPWIFCLIINWSLIAIISIVLSWFPIHGFQTSIYCVFIFVTMSTGMFFIWFWLVPVWGPREINLVISGPIVPRAVKVPWWNPLVSGPWVVKVPWWNSFF